MMKIILLIYLFVSQNLAEETPVFDYLSNGDSWTDICKKGSQ